VIDRWRTPEAIKIARSDDERMAWIREVTDEMRHRREQKNEVLGMKLRGEVDAKTFQVVTAGIDAVHDQLAREHNRLASEAAMPELPDPSLVRVEECGDDQGGGRRTSADKPKEGAEVTGGDEARHEEPGHAGLEQLVEYGKAIRGLDAVKEWLQIPDVRQIGLVAGGEHHIIHHELLTAGERDVDHAGG
jgi:hypothetical protein